jgi:hypothetical protein
MSTFYFNPMLSGMPTNLPDTAVPVSRWNTDQQSRRDDLKYKQTLDGSAWRSGGYLYNEITKDVVEQQHPSGLFTVYVDAPKKTVEPIEVKPPVTKKIRSSTWEARLQASKKDTETKVRE